MCYKKISLTIPHSRQMNLMNAGYSHLNEPVYFLQSCYLDIHRNSYSSRNEILCSGKKKIEMKLSDIRRK